MTESNTFSLILLVYIGLVVLAIVIQTLCYVLVAKKKRDALVAWKSDLKAQKRHLNFISQTTQEEKETALFELGDHYNIWNR